ncbi:DedA family protein [Geothrix sp. 21YS21S-2]|uniref:DedA family protein n=1 Tax=Geothrix sp. 21YS21S-2 TaxID=3068893 RepID=UPI0027B91E56|nr:DedA family protein [Geothrix sp. 21YS21S-2]
MLHKILAPIIVWMTAMMAAMGPMGVSLLMGIESACIPLPSEVIMPFAGFLAFKGQMTFLGLGAGSPMTQVWIAGVFGALGCNLGSIPAYELGAWGGRKAVERYGKYIFLNLDHLDQAHRFFEKFGRWAILIGRMLPVIRTFIALPAGIARMDRRTFHLYTFAGSLPWCLGLAWVGFKLGEKWDTLGVWFHRFDLVIGAVILAGIVWFLWSHLRKR